MPEEPDEVFYDWGGVVSEPSEPKKNYDENCRMRADICYQQAISYGNKLINNENRFRKYLWFAILSVVVSVALMFIWILLDNNGQQVDLSVLTLPQADHVPAQVPAQGNVEALNPLGQGVSGLLSGLSNFLLFVSFVFGMFFLFAGAFNLYKHAQGQHNQISISSAVMKLVCGLVAFSIPSILGIFTGVEVENSAANIPVKPSYTKQIEAFKGNPTLETWKGIEPLFDIPVNKPYLNYIKSATSDAESVKAVVADARSGKLKLQDNDHYICQLEEKYDQQVKISACQTRQSLADWVNSLFFVMFSITGIAVILSFAQWQGIRRRAINYQSVLHDSCESKPYFIFVA